MDLTQEEQQFYDQLMSGDSEAKAKDEYTKEPDVDFEEFARKSGVDVDSIKADIQKEDLTAKIVPALPSLQKTQGAPVETTIGNPGKGAAFGIADTVQGAINGAIDLADWFENTAAKFGMGSGDLITDASKVNWSEKLVVPEEEIGTRAMRSITRYAAPVVATMGAGAGIKAGLSAGALADFFLIDPKGDRLSDMLVNDVPEFKNFPVAYDVAKALSTKPDDTELESRFKNMVEGLAIGAPIAAGMLGITKFASNSKKGIKAAKDFSKVSIADEAAVAASEAKMGENLTQVNTAEATTQVVDDAQYDLFDYAATRVREDGSVRPNLNNDNVLEYMAAYAKANKDGDFLRGPKDFNELEQEAKDILTNSDKLDKLLAWRLGDRPLTDAEVKVSQYIMGHAATSVTDAAAKYSKTGAKEDLVHFVNMMTANNYITKIEQGAGSEAGRALNAHKLSAHLADIPLSEFNRRVTADQKKQLLDAVLKNSGGEAEIDKVAKSIAAIGEMSPEEAANAVAKANRAAKGNFKKMSEIVHFTAINGMMSSPKTAIANHLNNAQTAFKQTFLDNYLSAIPGTMRGGESARSWKQANDYLFGQMSALGEAMVAVKDAMKTGRGGPANIVKLDEFIPQNLAQQLDIPVERNLGYALLGKVANTYGMVTSIPTKLNGTADAFWGTLAYRGKLRELAGNEVTRRGLKGADADGFIAGFMKDPPVNHHNSAKSFAEQMTFSQALDPASFAGKVDQVLANTPGARTVTPFFKTSANVVSYTINNSPLGLLLPNSKTREALRLGGAEADMAVAKVASGTMLIGVGAWMYSNGMYSGPYTPNYEVKRALTETDKGWMSDSLKIGDSWVDIKRLDYVNSIMKLGAVVAAARNYISDEEYEQYAALAGTAVADFMTPEMMVDTYARMFSAGADILKGKDAGRPVSNIVADIASRIMPFSALGRDLKNLKDPYTVDTEVMRKDVNYFDELTSKITNRIKGQVPYFSEDLPIQRNIFGEPLIAPAGSLDGGGLTEFISPFASRKAENTELVKTLSEMAGFYEMMSPVDKTLYELPISLPPRTIKFNGIDIELTPMEYKNYSMYAAGLDPKSEKPLFGVSLRDQLENLRKQIKPNFEEPMSPIVYQKLVGAFGKVISTYRGSAQKMMGSDPDFMKRWKEQFDARMQLKDIGGE